MTLKEKALENKNLFLKKLGYRNSKITLSKNSLCFNRIPKYSFT